MWNSDAYAEQPNPQQGSYAPAAVAQAERGQHMATSTALVPVQQLPSAPAPVPVFDGPTDIPASMIDRVELCKFLADSDILPRALQGKPANLLLIMHKAMALSLPLSVAIEHLHVIDGKVGHSAELMRGMLFRNRHLLSWTTVSDKEVVGKLVLKHDPNNPRIEKFTIADATRMELTSKANWKKDPTSMLLARCTTRLISRHCPEIGLALGNLSAIDIEDDHSSEPVKASAEVIDRNADHAASELMLEAQQAETSEKLKEIGVRARSANLLEIPVEGGTTLQEALLRRIGEINASERAAKGGKG